MKRYKYQGVDERVFPTLGVTVSPGDVFESEHGDVPELVEQGWFEETEEPVTEKHSEAGPPEVPEPPEAEQPDTAEPPKRRGSRQREQ